MPGRGSALARLNWILLILRGLLISLSQIHWPGRGRGFLFFCVCNFWVEDRPTDLNKESPSQNFKKLKQDFLLLLVKIKHIKMI